MKNIIEFLNKDFFKFTLKENSSGEKGKEEYSGFFRRFGAAMVDLSAFTLLMIFLIWINLLNFPSSFVIFLIFPLYNAISLYFYEMTLGKYVFGIKIRCEKNFSNNFLNLLKREYILKPISIIFFGFGILRMLIDPHKQTYYDKKLKTEVVVWRNSWIDSLFIYAMVFSLLFEIIKTNIQKNSGHYTDINKPKIEITQTNNSLPTPTPTIYKCPIINQKTKEDIDRENAEKNLSSYTYQINYPNKKIVKVNFLEKKLLPCNYFDENYCQLKNEDKWIIKYPKNWQLYRIKKQVFDTYYDDNNPLTFYDLKFENGLSYFYLEEIITLGGNPSTLSRNQWNYIKNYCQNLFYSTDDGFENFICYGNILNCSYNIDGYFDQVYSINSYYKSFIQINSQIQKDETLIYDWYIPSIHFEESPEIKALRAYVFSTNFYSNDENFINEAIKMYLSAYLSFNKK